MGENFAVFPRCGRAEPVRRDFTRGTAQPPLSGGGPGDLAQGAAFLLPFVGAISQTQGAAFFRSDAALLASLGEAPQGLSGALSARLAQLASALPLGDLVYRTALIGAFFCALGGLAALHLSHFLFRKQGGISRLDPWLALGASLAVSFSLPWFEESTLSGGAAVGAGLALTLVSTLFISGLPRSLPGAAITGIGLGALGAESPWSGAVILLALLIIWPEAARLGELKVLRALATGAALKNSEGHIFKILTLLVGAAATWTLLLLPNIWAGAFGAAALETVAEGTAAHWPVHSVLSWVSSVGFLWCGGAIVGMLFGLSDKGPVVVLVGLIAVDLLAPGTSLFGWTEALSVDVNRKCLHLLALGVVGPLGALGLRTLAETAQALKLFAARPLAAMVAVIALAGCLAGAEDSLRTLAETGTSGAQTWTDEAISELPHRSLILTTSPAWGRRLLAAQVVGERPDLLVIPLDKVVFGNEVARYLKKEPALEHLLRDLSVSDTPSERAITRLVDQRRVYIEPDPTWDPRLVEHLVPGAPLAEAASHALARSDRMAAMDSIPPRRARILSACDEGMSRDVATRALFEEGQDRLGAIFQVVRDRRAGERLEEIRKDGREETAVAEGPVALLAQKL